MTRAADPLYVTEAEIAKILDMTVDDWRDTAAVLEKRGLPSKNPLFGDRRYWPAVRAFLDRREGVGAQSGQGIPARDGEERWDLNNVTRARRRA